MAIAYLKSLGFEIIEHNFREGHGEIDIIALWQNSLLVFVEVKRRKNSLFGQPEEFVSEQQQKKIIEVADAYIHAINWRGDLRFDIIAIDDSHSLNHIEDAFY